VGVFKKQCFGVVDRALSHDLNCAQPCVRSDTWFDWVVGLSLPPSVHVITSSRSTCVRPRPCRFEAYFDRQFNARSKRSRSLKSETRTFRIFRQRLQSIFGGSAMAVAGGWPLLAHKKWHGCPPSGVLHHPSPPPKA